MAETDSQIPKADLEEKNDELTHHLEGLENLELNEDGVASDDDQVHVPLDVPIINEDCLSDEETLSDDEKEAKKLESMKLKTEGNESFNKGEFENAEKIYSSALKSCPKSYAKERAVLYANRAACKMKLDLRESAVTDCSKALEHDPQYVKALLRRASLYESLEKLDDALNDYKAVLEIDPHHSTATVACQALPLQIHERNEKLKTEMIGKLKDLGNMILKPFGLSTNNFQMQQDPNTGGYSVNFQQKPAS